MPAPDVVGLAGIPGRGRFLALYLQIRDGRVNKAQFESHGCGVTIACGSALTELVIGRDISDCACLSAKDLVEALDGIPPDRGDCPDFAMQALRHVLEQMGAVSTTP